MTYWALNWRVPLRDLYTCENVLLKEKILAFLSWIFAPTSYLFRNSKDLKPGRDNVNKIIAFILQNNAQHIFIKEHFTWTVTSMFILFFS